MQKKFMVSLAQNLFFQTDAKQMKEVLEDYQSFLGSEEPKESVKEIMSNLKEEGAITALRPMTVLFTLFFSLILPTFAPFILLSMVYQGNISPSIFYIALLLLTIGFPTSTTIFFGEKLAVLSQYFTETRKHQKVKISLVVGIVLVVLYSLFIIINLCFSRFNPLDTMEYSALFQLLTIGYHGSLCLSVVCFAVSAFAMVSLGAYFHQTLCFSYFSILTSLFVQVQRGYFRESTLLTSIIFIIVSLLALFLNVHQVKKR